MILDVKIPEIGENITSGTVVKIAVSSQDAVKKDQPLIELETEKATIEIPSPEGGAVKEVLVKEGDEVQVGQVIVRIDTGEHQSTSAPEHQSMVEPEQQTNSTPVHQNTSVPEPQSADEQQPITNDQPPATSDQPATSHQRPATDIDVPASPSVRKFAREIGINIGEVPGAGPSGRISIEDVKAYAKKLNTGMIQRPKDTNNQRPATSDQRPLPDFSKWGEIDRQPMNNIRRKTAEMLSHAWITIPHVTQFAKADITELEKLRKQHSTPDLKLTITPFLLKVAAAALKHFPQFNASVDMTTQEIIIKKYHHIGVAVDTDRGLLVPVIRDADQKGILQMARELNEAAERARNKKTSIEEMRGGTFTITNLGGIGGTGFTPIVNWPEVAILGVSRAQMESNFSKDLCAPRLMLPLSLSYDHRVIDGADGARFIKWMVDAIQQPFLLELE